MILAARIEILNDSLQATDTVNLYQQEVLESQVTPFQPVNSFRVLGGGPYIEPFGDPWHIIALMLRSWGSDTSTKLSTIRTAAQAGNLFRVYPAKVDFADLVFDCFLPADVPIDFIFSGRISSDDREPLVFFEASKDATGVWMGYGFVV